MARKKPARKTKVVSIRKPALKNLKKKTATKKRPVAKKRPAAKKKLVARKTLAATKKLVAMKMPAAKKKTRVKARTKGKQEITNPIAVMGRRGLGPSTGGQSGDTQGLSRREYVDSESVAELLEEGQYMEAEAVGGVENAKDPDEGEVQTSEVSEDDVPEEYEDQD